MGFNIDLQVVMRIKTTPLVMDLLQQMLDVACVASRHIFEQADLAAERVDLRQVVPNRLNIDNQALKACNDGFELSELAT